MGPRAGLLKATSLAIVEDTLVHEGPVIIRVQSKHREWQISRRFLKPLNDQHLVAQPYCYTFCPAARDVCQREGMDKVIVGLRAATVFDHVDLEESR